jgi:cell division protein ZapE
MMDEFFRCAGGKRVHFHRFMQGIHHQLRDCRANRTAADHRADSGGYPPGCLDEFHVTDIGDAMLMRGLLDGLFDRGVALVTTSNQCPDELYLHGLQRAQFAPAIELIKNHCHVVELDGDSDYRLRALERAGVYHWPLGERAEAAQEAAFIGVAGEAGEAGVELEVDGRVLHAQRVGPGIAWFDFAELCDRPRGTADYIELARRYHTVLISRVPQLRPATPESVRRYWLIDEFYDRRVKLSCRRSPLQAVRGAGTPELERTRNRLVEMQTSRYLSQAHLA